MTKLKQIFLIFFILFTNLSCNRPNYNEEVKDFATICRLPQCSEKDLDIICSEYPYKDGAIIETKIWVRLGCVYCSGDIVSSEKINQFCQIRQESKNFPKFYIDKNIKYRLWYGNKSYQWIAIRYSNCIILNAILKCQYEDNSDILKIIVMPNHLKIIKEKSVWFLYNYHDETEMILKLMEHE